MISPNKISAVWRKKKILILGFGREGFSSLRYLLGQKIPSQSITIADQKKLVNFEPLYRQKLQSGRFRLLLGPDYLRDISHYEIIIKTPGLKLAPELTKKINSLGIILTSNLNIFLAAVKGRIIAVSGTKGKSTTTALIAHILKTAGKKTVLCGNIGRPFLNYLGHNSKDIFYLAEVSSYQLETLREKVDLAVLTSFFPEHLDYHGTLANYFAAKMNLARHLKSGGLVIYNPAFLRLKNFFRRNNIPSLAAAEADFSLAGRLLGRHNRQNIGLALKTAELLGVSRAAITKALKSFRGLPDRLEYLGIFGAVHFYNDVLSTTPESAIAAILALRDKRPLTLIVGGLDRGLNYQPLAAAIKKEKIDSVLCWPHAGEKIFERLKKIKYPGRLARVADMSQTVKKAFHFTSSGGTVLLSPAASSYDYYSDYRAKGADFRQKIIASVQTKD